MTKPVCFIHVPKCAGSSIYTSLVKALPPGSVSGKRMDGAMLGPGLPNLDSLTARVRETVAGTPEEIAELASDPVICGHFLLSTLAALTSSELIGITLREPRARLLSQYVYWRTETPGGAPQFQPREYALRPLDEFLSEPALAHANDNIVCRMLLEPDSRLPSRQFIASSDVESVASDAADQLDALGFVGILELGDMVWHGLSRLFGVALAEEGRNVTDGRTVRSEAGPLARPFTGRTLSLLEARTRADGLLYQHAVFAAGCSAEEQARLRDAAFANQLVQLGDTMGHSAIALANLRSEGPSGPGSP